MFVFMVIRLSVFLSRLIEVNLVNIIFKKTRERNDWIKVQIMEIFISLSVAIVIFTVRISSVV